MNTEKIIFFGFSVFVGGFAFLGYKILPTIISKNWHNRSEKMEIFLLKGTFVFSIFCTIASIFILFIAFIFEKL